MPFSFIKQQTEHAIEDPQARIERGGLEGVTSTITCVLAPPPALPLAARLPSLQSDSRTAQATVRSLIESPGSSRGGRDSCEKQPFTRRLSSLARRRKHQGSIPFQCRCSR